MEKRRTGKSELAKETNISIILELLHAKAPLSRIDIARTTGLSPATVTAMTEELLQKGFLQESGAGEFTGGRRPILLEPSPKARYTIAIHITAQRVELAVVNFINQIYFRRSRQFDELSQNVFVSVLSKWILEVIKDSGIDPDKIIAIGIAVPGPVDAKKGVIIQAQDLNFQDLHLKEELQAKLPYPVLVERDVHAFIWAEKWLGAGKDAVNLLYVWLVPGGIGVGAVVNGVIYYGENMRAGELGHMTIDWDGQICTCGLRGCWQQFVSEQAMRRILMTAITEGKQTVLTQFISSPKELTTAQVMAAYRQKDALAQDIIEEVAGFLGIGIANLVNAFDPEVVIVGGELIEAGEVFLEKLRRTVTGRVYKIPTDTLKIVPAKLKDDGGCLGASLLVSRGNQDYYYVNTRWTGELSR